MLKPKYILFLMIFASLTVKAKHLTFKNETDNRLILTFNGNIGQIIGGRECVRVKGLPEKIDKLNIAHLVNEEDKKWGAEEKEDTLTSEEHSALNRWKTFTIVHNRNPVSKRNFRLLNPIQAKARSAGVAAGSALKCLISHVKPGIVVDSHGAHRAIVIR